MRCISFVTLGLLTILTACGPFKATDKNLPERYRTVYNMQAGKLDMATQNQQVTRQTTPKDSIAQAIAARKTGGVNATIIPGGQGPIRNTPIPLNQVSIEQIKLVQANLKSKGYHVGAVNGTWDIATSQAVIAFQQDHHLKPLGVLTIETMEALGLSWQS